MPLMLFGATPVSSTCHYFNKLMMVCGVRTESSRYNFNKTTWERVCAVRGVVCALECVLDERQGNGSAQNLLVYKCKKYVLAVILQ